MAKVENRYGWASSKMTIGTMLRKLRLIEGWTQAVLAEKLDVDPAIISLLERGKRPIKGVIHEKILKIFRVGSID
jgi:transcriptional regulator with XRE-family HTH domain